MSIDEVFNSALFSVLSVLLICQIESEKLPKSIVAVRVKRKDFLTTDSSEAELETFTWR